MYTGKRQRTKAADPKTEVSPWNLLGRALVDTGFLQETLAGVVTAVVPRLARLVNAALVDTHVCGEKP